MQTKKGTAPQALDASDFAGQLELDLLVKMAAAHGWGTREYTDACILFAAKINKLWVDFPFFMSIDNATVHPHGRSRLMKPRDPPPQILQQMREDILQLMMWCIGTAYILSPERVAEASDMISTHARMGSSLNSVALQDDLLTMYYRFCELDPYLIRPALYHRHRLVFHAEQYMPLSSKSPDLHQPVEHFVGVLKGKVKKWAQQEADIYDPVMFKARTWQSIVECSVQQLMAGAEPDAPRFVKGSIAKWRNCVKIVPADVDQLVQCHHTAGLHSKPATAKRARSAPAAAAAAAAAAPAEAPLVTVTTEERGTAGRWPPACYC
jgi:hypothetical protein